MMMVHLQPGQDANTLRTDLWWALRTRPLSDSELEQVRRWGYSLNQPIGSCFSAHEKAIEFDAALARQFEMRLVAEQQATPTPRR